MWPVTLAMVSQGMPALLMNLTPVALQRRREGEERVRGTEEGRGENRIEKRSSRSRSTRSRRGRSRIRSRRRMGRRRRNLRV